MKNRQMLAALIFMLTNCSFENLPDFAPDDFNDQSGVFYNTWSMKPLELVLDNNQRKCIVYGRYCSKVDADYDELPSDCRPAGENSNTTGQYYCSLYTKNGSSNTLESSKLCRPCSYSFKSYFRISFQQVAASAESDTLKKQKADVQSLRNACNIDVDVGAETLGHFYTTTVPDLEATEFSSEEGTDELDRISSFSVKEGSYCEDNFPISSEG